MITTTTASCISVRPSWSWSYGGVIYNYICHILHDICSCKSHNHMITTKMAPCISVIYDIGSCKSHHHMVTTTIMITTTTATCISVIPSWSWSYGGVIYNYICHILLKYKRPSSYGGVIYNYICHIFLKYKEPSWSWSYGGVIYN
jgi:hypothetical protein